MKKLVLDLDAVEVSSFETGSAPGPRGTVHANGPTRGNSCADCPDTTANTCQVSCDPSCISTCPVAPCYTGDETCVC